MTSSTNNQISIVPANEHSVESFERSYTPAGDKICSHGRDYQYKVIMYLLCKQLNANSREFRLACEMEDAGKFDDIVLHYVENDEWKYKLFQLKHTSDNKKNIKSEMMFCSKNSSLRLNMYFDSFQEDIKDKNFETNHKGKITELALVTNVGLEFSNDQHKNIFEECDEEMMRVYKFKKDHIELVNFLKGEPSLRGKVFNENGNLSLVAEDFFNKLRIYVNFRDEKIEQGTKDEIEKFLHDEAYVDYIYKDLYNTIAGWVSDPRAYFVGRQESMKWFDAAKEKIKNPSNVFSEFHLNRIETHGIRFTEVSLREFGIKIEQNAYIQVKTRCSVDFSLVKVVQCLKKGTFRVISDDEFKTYDQNRLISDLRLNKVSVLVIACSSCETTLDIPSWERVRFIIVSKSISLRVNNVQCIDDDIQFNELMPLKQQELLEKEVLFQTRHMKVEQVFRPDIRHIISNEFLFKLITSADPIEIVPSADMLRSTDASYIGRRVTYRNEIDINRFDFNDKDDIFVFSGMTETDLQNLRLKKSSKNRYDLSRKDKQLTDSKEKHETDNLFLLPEQNTDQEFKLLCELNDKKNILWIEHSQTKFYLHKSHGSIKHVRNFICERVTNQFDDHQLTDRSGDLIIICASPGMGKTALLSRLASKFIEKHQNTWVIYVNLMDYVKEFEARKTFDDESSTEFIFKTQYNNTQHFDTFEKNLFAVWSNITILFDAFDEIAPDHRQPVVDLVTSLNKNKRFNIYITSRPNEQEYLEDEFNRLCHQLAPFEKEDAVSFLKKRWNTSGNGDEARSMEFIEAIIDSVESSTANESGRLMNTPLECRLIGDVFEKKYEEFIRDPCNDLSVPKRVDVLKLFEEFVRLKWRIYVEEKTQRDIDSALPANRKDLEDSLKLFKENHQLASIYLLFGDEINFENVKTHHYECILERKEKCQLERFLKAIESGEEKTGIIESVRDGTPKYTHRMFAEYFAAEFFHELIKCDPKKSREFLTKTIFHSERKTLKHFFDLLSIKDRTSSKIFKTLLNGDEHQFNYFMSREESSTFINSTDKFNRNALHLCATYEFDNIFKQLLRYEFDMNARDFFGYTPVQYACVAQMWKNVDLLLTKHDENITNFISDKKQCLLHASKNGYKEIVRNLMEYTEATHRDELINTIDEDKKTPLYYAAISGHASLSKYIMEETDVNLNQKYDSDENTILHLLARISEERDGSVEIVRLLANTDLVNTRNTDGQTPLYHAALLASKSVCECLLNANKVDVFVTDNYKLTVLHILAATHDQEKIGLVSELVSRGISIEARDVFGRTPLHVACRFGSRAHCEYLIKKMKADVKAVDNENSTTLHRLAANTKENMAEIARLMVSEGISIDARDVFERTPLHVACEFGSRALCEYLIKEMKADVKAVDNENSTTLHRLAANTKENMAEIARLLVSEGISIEARDVFGRTPLHFACELGSRALCEYLIKERKADVKAVSNKNSTALHYLAANTKENMAEVARLLVSEGTLIETRNVFGSTPLHVACAFGSRALCEYLIKEMKADIMAVDNENRSTLHYLGRNTNDHMVEVARLLISEDISIEAHDVSGNTPLSIALECGSSAFSDFIAHK